MTYKDHIKVACYRAAKDHRVVFIGYNVRFGGKGGGAYYGINEAQLIETPLAENLMAGIAIGMSLDGYRPVLYFERCDFILIALDAIVNHLDKMAKLSGGKFNPCAIIRVVIGNTDKPLYTGLTHTQNFHKALAKLVSFPVVRLTSNFRVVPAWEAAYDRLMGGESTLLIEYKDLYEQSD